MTSAVVTHLRALAIDLLLELSGQTLTFCFSSSTLSGSHVLSHNTTRNRSDMMPQLFRQILCAATIKICLRIFEPSSCELARLQLEWLRWQLDVAAACPAVHALPSCDRSPTDM